MYIFLREITIHCIISVLNRYNRWTSSKYFWLLLVVLLRILVVRLRRLYTCTPRRQRRWARRPVSIPGQFVNQKRPTDVSWRPADTTNQHLQAPATKRWVAAVEICSSASVWSGWWLHGSYYIACVLSITIVEFKIIKLSKKISFKGGTHCDFNHSFQSKAALSLHFSL